MATADGIYRRLQGTHQRLFDDRHHRPSLALAHSASRSNPLFNKSIASASQEWDTQYATEDQSATAQCTAWLADSNKQAVLAHVGVGTIDQALLSVLPARHQALRLLGIGRQVLIVDEVHAYDAYMHSLLCNLLTFQASLGGSAILLSATLPQQTRAELAASFRKGLEMAEPPNLLMAPPSQSYPLLTTVSATGVQEYPTPTRPEVMRHVATILEADERQIERLLIETAQSGGCACWIRNTVADAVAAFDRLSREFPKTHVQLFHARFALRDRLAIQQAVLDSFGPESQGPARQGRIVIATQVVEQSLDLDFDVMVSDLAPIDLLIQRAGRLQRHQRDAKGNPHHGRDGRNPPTLVIFSPQPNPAADSAWYQRHLPSAAFVYPNHGQLWLTAKILADRNGWTMPDDARLLIEGVYGPENVPLVPEDLRQRDRQADDLRRQHVSLAHLHGLSVDDGYTETGTPWKDDILAVTRLGEPTVTLRLARWDGSQMTLWAAGSSAPGPQSEVTIAARKLAKITYTDLSCQKAADIIQRSDRSLDRNHILVPLIETDPGLWTATGIDGGGKAVTIQYSPVRGLMISKAKSNDPKGGTT